MVGLQQTIGSIWITMIIMIFSHIANKNWKLSPWDASEGREVLKHYPWIYFLHLFCEVSPTPPRNTTLSNPQSFNILYLLGGRGGFAGGRKVIVEPHRHEGKTS